MSSKEQEEDLCRGSFNPLLQISIDAGDDIVITGVSGRFPECNNLTELRENLMNKVDMVTDGGPRWALNHPDAPVRMGRINNIESFDADFFDYDFKQAHTMDPQGRMLLEHVYEAIVDSGTNPEHLRNTNTGVFVGCCQVDSEITWAYQEHEAARFGTIGSCRAMLANRVSQWLGIKGPSYSVDSACSTSLLAIEQGYNAIRSGLCDAALVCGTQLGLNPYVAIQCTRLGALCRDGRSKTFDNSANGYVRSEAVGVAYLQKAKNAKRIYATLIHGKTNCDGFTEQGIMFPSGVMQRNLLTDLYEECRIPTSSLAYLEAHGTGTKAGDLVELTTIESCLCPGREEPLRIGAVKSNIGHTEGASGISQICKVIIASESGFIPPNLHYKVPREGVRGLVDGRMKVVTEPTPWSGGYIGIMAFGSGGMNVHLLLKSNPKEKINGGTPDDNLPRLVVASGRTEEAVNTILTDVEGRPVDAEYIRLLHDLHEENLSGHPYRGYTIVGGSSRMLRKVHHLDAKRPVWFVFPGGSSRWPSMHPSFLQFPVFATAITKCDAILKPRGVNIHDILSTLGGLNIKNIMNYLIGVTAMQIGLIDLLTSLGIVIDGTLGDSLGELGCAYADGSLTAEQTILITYSLALTIAETKTGQRTMAIVDLDYEKLKRLCPPDIEVVRNNSCEKFTVSGPVKSMQAFIAQLKLNNLRVCGIPSYKLEDDSLLMEIVGSQLHSRLQTVIPERKPPCSRWLSKSIHKSSCRSHESNLSSAEYQTNNSLLPVVFQEACALIPENAIIIELGATCQSISKQFMNPQQIHVSLIGNNHEDNVEFFLQAIGQLYNAGMQLAIAKLYPEIKFPVSRGTPMISPLIRWNHSQHWFVNCFQQGQKMSSGARVVELSLDDDEYEYMISHVIDGENLLPVSGYLILVWKTIAMLKEAWYPDTSVIFEDVTFLRTIILSQKPVSITIMIQKGTGRFEVIEAGVAVVTGVVRSTDNVESEQMGLTIPLDDALEVLNTEDVYKGFRIRGYQYAGQYKGIKSMTLDGTRGTINWEKNWGAFIENMLEVGLLGFDRGLLVPTRIEKVVIDTKRHSELIRNMCDEQEFKVYVNKKHDTIVSGGIEIRSLHKAAIPRKKEAKKTVREIHQFVPYRDHAVITLKDAVHLALCVSMENHLNVKVKTLEYLGIGEEHPLEEFMSVHILNTLARTPLVQSDVSIITTRNTLEKGDLPESINFMEPQRLTSDLNALIIAGRNLLAPGNSAIFSRLLSTLKDGGFVISLEISSPEIIRQSLQQHGISVISERLVDGSIFLHLRKNRNLPETDMIIKVKKEDFTWLDKLKSVLKLETARKTVENSRIVLVNDGAFDDGLLGLIRCLRKEPGGERIRGVLIQDQNAPEFSSSDPLYANQLKLDLVINVLRPQSIWGSYIHLSLPLPSPRPVHHAFVNQCIDGDLSSLCWMEGPIPQDAELSDVVKVIYSSLNSKDLMLATGKLTENLTDLKRVGECGFGFEYAGITMNGSRVMGITDFRGITNILKQSAIVSWDVPDCWSLDEAATVPWAYATCCYALYSRAMMKRGDKVLIHSGAGSIGQAAINLALWTGCEIFTTVSSLEKRAFIRKTFPQIPENHIGNSRNTSFEQSVMNVTKGKGVNIVLNTLTDDKFEASIRCLSDGGKFLEIGQFDITNGRSLGISTSLRGISFHCISQNQLLSTLHNKKELHELLQNRLNAGAVKPLKATIFQRDEMERAFTLMASGNHIGKIILKIQDENNPEDIIPALPRYYCREDRSYIILGGLGGFGLELANWLICRGCRKLLLTSRSGIKNGYQQMKIELWRNYGIKVIVVTEKDASNVRDCEDIILTASTLAPVDAIYNLAVVLKDSLFENQTTDSFQVPFKAKPWSTKILDEVSRTMCSELRHFVVFSSVTSGRGNMGQTNYGMANSIMERICERRCAEGLPGLAIQWGAIGDVGLVADIVDSEKEYVVEGTVRQNIASCLKELDIFLTQTSPVVASMVLADKISGASGSLNVVDTIANIMCIKDAESISLYTSLANLGMDSMVAVEIKKTLEQEFEICLTAKDIRDLNFAKMNEWDAKRANEKMTMNV